MTVRRPPLRVAQLIKGLGRGGAEMLLPQVISAFGDGIESSVAYFLPQKTALVGTLEEAGTPVRRFTARTAPGLLLQVPALARWLRRQEIGVLHAHLPLAGVAGRLAGRLARVPVVYTEHNLLERYHPATRRANLLTWSWQAAVVAVSGPVADSIRRLAGERVPLRVIHNGIVVPPPAPPAEVERLRARYGLAAESPVIGTVAVMRTQKRLDLWLEAAERLARRDPRLRFVVVGDGPLRGELEARAAALGLGARVVFTGLQTEVRPFLQLFDLFLSSSRFEGLPLALLEAMAAGLPVVATAVGGVPEALRDGREGLLVPFGDVDRLAAAAAAILDDPELGRRFGERGRQRVEEAFGIRRMAGELEDLYGAVGAAG